jgi:hypothetical protein
MHRCRYPRWHQVLIGTGTLGWLYSVGLVFIHPLLNLGLLLGTVVVFQALQGRCRPSARGSQAQGWAILLGSASLLGRQGENKGRPESSGGPRVGFGVCRYGPSPFSCHLGPGLSPGETPERSVCFYTLTRGE